MFLLPVQADECTRGLGSKETMVLSWWGSETQKNWDLLSELVR